MDTPIADVKLENLIRFWMYFVGSPHNKTRFIHAVDGCEILFCTSWLTLRNMKQIMGL